MAILPQMGHDAAADGRLQRLGLDIHDGPLQELAVVSSRLYGLREVLAAESGFERTVALERTDAMIADVSGIADQLRALARETRGRYPSRPLLSFELGRTIDLYLDSFEIDLDVQVDERGWCEEQVVAVARIVQAALANVAQHSGAQRAEIVLRSGREATVLEIHDDGVGFDVASSMGEAASDGRIGLSSIQERVRSLGGTVLVESRIGGPTVIRVVLPDAETAPARLSLVG